MKRNCTYAGGDSPSVPTVRKEKRQASCAFMNCQIAFGGAGLESQIYDNRLLIAQSDSSALVGRVDSQSHARKPDTQSWFSTEALIATVRRICEERNPLVFLGCCLFIALVGILDTWLVVIHPETIFDMEKNPICLFLLQQDPNNMFVFVTAKLIGILIVLCVLTGLFRYWKKYAMHVTLAITFFQFSLVCYLYVLSDLAHLYRVYID